jgi:homoserine dehydrogenase
LSIYSGPGAGALPTAAAVVADLIRVARGELRPKTDTAVPINLLSVEQIEAPFYLRIPVLDQPGVLARLASLLAAAGISIESVIQREQAVRTSASDSWVPIVLLTERVVAGALHRALETMAASADVVGEIVSIRIEPLRDE